MNVIMENDLMKVYLIWFCFSVICTIKYWYFFGFFLLILAVNTCKIFKAIWKCNNTFLLIKMNNFQ